jgi:hypothetical protein
VHPPEPRHRGRTRGTNRSAGAPPCQGVSAEAERLAVDRSSGSLCTPQHKHARGRSATRSTCGTSAPTPHPAAAPKTPRSCSPSSDPASAWRAPMVAGTPPSHMGWRSHRRGMGAGWGAPSPSARPPTPTSTRACSSTTAPAAPSSARGSSPGLRASPRTARSTTTTWFRSAAAGTSLSAGTTRPAPGPPTSPTRQPGHGRLVRPAADDTRWPTGQRTRGRRVVVPVQQLHLRIGDHQGSQHLPAQWPHDGRRDPPATPEPPHAQDFSQP